LCIFIFHYLVLSTYFARFAPARLGTTPPPFQLLDLNGNGADLNGFKQQPFIGGRAHVVDNVSGNELHKSSSASNPVATTVVNETHIGSELSALVDGLRISLQDFSSRFWQWQEQCANWHLDRHNRYVTTFGDA
jgi:hypothetical protein